MSKDMDASVEIVTHIILKSPDGSERVVEYNKATTDEILQWVNQAPDTSNRQRRKAIVYCKMYNMGPIKFIDMLGFKKKEGDL